jgi:hypothetical protein
MQIAATTPGIQPELPFAQASFHYTQAQKSLEFPPNAMIDVNTAVSSALEHTTKAIELLTPATSSSDMFVGRNATASVESAKTGVTALKNALALLEAPAGSMPQIPLDTFLTIARNSITQADTALWWE